MSTGDRDLVRYDESAGVAVLTLDDPRRRNVLSGRLVDGLLAAVDRAEREAGALVVTGSPPAFCAGAELDTLKAAREGEFGPVEHVYDAFLRVARCALPTIAAVGGPAVGAGFNLALACDVRVAADNAWFDSRFHKLGIHPGGGHAWMLDRLAGREAAIAMVVLGQRVDAHRARDLGLVWDVVAAGGLLDRAVALGAVAAGQDRELMLKTLATVRSATTVTEHDEAVDIERRAQRWSLGRETAARAFEEMTAALAARD